MSKDKMTGLKKCAISYVINDWYSNWSGDEIDIYNAVVNYGKSGDVPYTDYAMEHPDLEDAVLYGDESGKEYLGMKDFAEDLECAVRISEGFLSSTLSHFQENYEDGNIKALVIRITDAMVREVARTMYDLAKKFGDVPDERLLDMEHKDVSAVLSQIEDGYDFDFGVDSNTIRCQICAVLELDLTKYNC